MLDPKSLGVVSKADSAAFLLGAAIGGALDAIFDVAPFAEPLMFAAICGTGVLGAKQAIDAAIAHRKRLARARLKKSDAK